MSKEYNCRVFGKFISLLFLLIITASIRAQGYKGIFPITIENYISSKTKDFQKFLLNDTLTFYIESSSYESLNQLDNVFYTIPDTLWLKKKRKRPIEDKHYKLIWNYKGMRVSDYSDEYYTPISSLNNKSFVLDSIVFCGYGYDSFDTGNYDFYMTELSEKRSLRWRRDFLNEINQKGYVICKKTDAYCKELLKDYSLYQKNKKQVSNANMDSKSLYEEWKCLEVSFGLNIKYMGSYLALRIQNTKGNTMNVNTYSDHLQSLGFVPREEYDRFCKEEQERREREMQKEQKEREELQKRMNAHHRGDERIDKPYYYKIIQSSPIITNIVGWSYDSSNEKWAGYYNALIGIYRENNKKPIRASLDQLGGYEDISSMQFKKITYNETPYYLLYIKKWEMWYSYPSIYRGRNNYEDYSIFVFTEEEYNKIWDLKDGINKIKILNETGFCVHQNRRGELVTEKQGLSWCFDENFSGQYSDYSTTYFYIKKTSNAIRFAYPTSTVLLEELEEYNKGKSRFAQKSAYQTVDFSTAYYEVSPATFQKLRIK